MLQRGIPADRWSAIHWGWRWRQEAGATCKSCWKGDQPQSWFTFISSSRNCKDNCHAMSEKMKLTSARTRRYIGKERVHLLSSKQLLSWNVFILISWDPRGHEDILITRWVEVALPSQNAEVTAAVNECFSRFVYPFQIHSDQGRNFEGKLFTALCKALHIQKTRTIPYRPASNGQVERFQRMLMDAVRCFITDQNDGYQHLQQIAGSLRSSVSRSTWFSANKLMLGREVNTRIWCFR